MSQKGMWIAIAIVIIAFAVILSVMIFGRSEEGPTGPQGIDDILATKDPTTDPIPEGAIYYVGVTSTERGNYKGASKKYEYGSHFPSTVNVGDVFVYDGYEYRYNMKFSYEQGWKETYDTNGWGVVVLDQQKEEYPDLLMYVGETPVVYLQETFSGCVNMINAPMLPGTATNMNSTFSGCSSLRVVDSIPINISSMSRTFENCTNLTHSPEIPMFVKRMSGTFYGCSSLVAAPTIPESVVNMNDAFYGCSSLADDGMPNIPSKVTSLIRTFSGCTSLVDLSSFKIPDTVENACAMFQGCTSLMVAPVVPSGVDNIMVMFAGCTSLSGEVIINASPSEFEGCFRETNDWFVLSGSSKMLKQIENTRSVPRDEE